MTLPVSGPLSASQINVELGRAVGAAFSMNDAGVRGLAGKPSGLISFSDLLGKSARTYVFNANLTVGNNGNEWGYSKGYYGGCSVGTISTNQGAFAISGIASNVDGRVAFYLEQGSYTNQQCINAATYLNTAGHVMWLAGVAYQCDWFFDDKFFILTGAGDINSPVGYFNNKAGQVINIKLSN